MAADVGRKKLETKEIAKYRKALLANCNGKILELGIDTGANLAYYPTSVKKITGVDRSLKKLCRVIPETEHYYVDYKELPFETDSFDTVVATFFFHEIVDLTPILEEIRRVLRQRGRLIFLDYGKAEDSFGNVVQNLVNPFCEILIGNVIHRDYFELLRQEQFLLANHAIKKLKISPQSLYGTVYMGVAINNK